MFDTVGLRPALNMSDASLERLGKIVGLGRMGTMSIEVRDDGSTVLHVVDHSTVLTSMPPQYPVVRSFRVDLTPCKGPRSVSCEV